MEVLGQSWDLRQVLQLQWVITGGKRESLFLKPAGSFWGIWRLVLLLNILWRMFPGRVPWWGIGMWLLQSCYHCWVFGATFKGFINIWSERKRKGGCGVKKVLGICLVEATRWKSERVERILVGGLLWLHGNFWQCLCRNLLEMDPVVCIAFHD